MNIQDLMTAAAELELVAAKLYDTLADVSADETLTRALRAISNDEVCHANALSVGKKVHQEGPDVFSRINMEEEEIQQGIQEGTGFRAELKSGFDLTEGLKKMIELERRFERIHINTSIKITNPSLKRLFEALTKGDRSHIITLNRLINMREKQGYPA